MQLMIVGYSSPKPPLLIGWGIPQRGWEPAIRDRHAKVLRQTGAGWLWVHNPFGAFKDERMQWTARSRLLRLAEAGDQNARRVDETFLPTMRRLLRGEFTNGRRIGVVCYLGDATTDTLLQPLLENDDNDQWRELWSEAVKPIRQLAAEFPGQVMLGADSIEELPADHPHFLLLRHLHRNELPVIGEPRFLADKPHLFEFGMAHVWRQDHGGFDRTDPERFQDSRGVANDLIRGPRFAFYPRARTDHIEEGKMSFNHLRKVMRTGSTPVLDMQALIAELDTTDD